MTVLGYLPKLNSGLRLAFDAHIFRMVFPWKCSLFTNQLTKLNISNKMCCLVLLKTIDDVINLKIYYPLKQWPTAKRKEPDGNTKF